MLACELVDDAIEKGCPAHTFVFDRWYLCKTLTDHIESHGRNWIGAVKSNRIIHYKGKQMSIGNFARSLEEGNLKHVQLKDKEYWALSRVVLVNNLGKVTIVVAWDNKELKGDPLLLATNSLEWETKRIIKIYGKRWPIETFYRDGKQHLGLEDCQLRSAKGIERHLYLVFLAYSLLILDIKRTALGRCISSLKTIGDGCRKACCDLIRSLIIWVYNHLRVYRPETNNDLAKSEIDDIVRTLCGKIAKV